ncbi:MAG: hypothetical protein ACRCW0_02065 [Clostridium sp.]
MNKNDFKFVSTNEPSEEIIEEFHTQLAKSLINKYGEEFIREALKQMDK